MTLVIMVHGLPYGTMTHAPFMCQHFGLSHELAQCVI